MEKDREREREGGVPRSNEGKPAPFLLLLPLPLTSSVLIGYSTGTKLQRRITTEVLDMCVYTVCFLCVLACNVKL